MADERNRSDLRRRAEEILSRRGEEVRELDSEELRSVVHDLQVYQIDLEIQNEELKRVHRNLEGARDRFQHLYHHAPAGYLTLDASGHILRANRTFAAMVGAPLEGLDRRPLAQFIHEDDRRLFHARFRSVFGREGGKSLTVRLGSPGPERFVRLEGRVGEEAGAEPEAAREGEHLLVVVIDVTEQRRAERALERSNRELRLRQEIAQIMLSSSDEEMYAEVLNTLLRIFRSEYGYFGHIDESGDLVCPSMVDDVYASCRVEHKSIVFPRDTWSGLWGHSLETQVAAFKNGDLKLPPGHMALYNSLVAPVVHGEEVIGQLALANKQGGYNEEDRETLVSIASWLSPVLHARLQRDQQERERCRVEDELRRTTTTVTQTLESISDAFMSLDQDLVVTYFNQAAEQVLDRRREEVLGRPLFAVFPEAAGSVFETRYREALRDREPLAFETHFESEPYQNWYEVRIYPQPGGISVYFRVITERKQAEEELRRSRNYLATTLHSIGDGVITTDREGRVTGMNPVAQELTGWHGQEACGRALDRVFDIRNSETGELVENPVWRALREGQVVGLANHTVLRSRQGEQFQIADSAAPITTGEGEVLGSVLVFRDITDEYRMVHRLRQSEKEKSLILNSTSELFAYYDAEFNLVWANRAAARSAGLDDGGQLADGACHQQWHKRKEPCPECPVRRAAQSLEVEEQELETPDGRSWHLRGYPVLDGDGRLQGVVEVGRETTEQKRLAETSAQLEAELRHTQKLEALGTLAGGVAHEFNNILAAIIGYSELSLIRSPDEELTQNLHEILRVAERARVLVGQILAFGRKSARQLKPVNVNEVVNQTRTLLQSISPRMVRIETDLASNPLRVEADTGQLEQVLVNLGMNAVDAMPDGGRLTYRTKVRLLEGEEVPPGSGLDEGWYLVLSVEDTGHGMDEITRSRVFDPFFTTKAPGKGTGLGLASVHGIVATHGGHIRCHSEPEEGTTFQVFLPASVPAVESAAGGPSAAPSGRDAETETVVNPEATILVVDDEPDLRDIGRRFLERSGYRTLAAASGEDALQLYRESGGDIDLVLLDLSMPGMGGVRCLQELRQLDPGVAVCVMSGHADASGPAGENPLASAAGYLAKPFSSKELLETVRQVLQSPSPGSSRTSGVVLPDAST